MKEIVMKTTDEAKSTFDILHTIDDWRVVAFKYTGGEFTYVEHCCPEGPFKDWHGYRYTYSSFPVPCHECEQLVPEGIQGVYVLISGDMDPHSEPWIKESEREEWSDLRKENKDD